MNHSWSFFVRLIVDNHYKDFLNSDREWVMNQLHNSQENKIIVYRMCKRIHRILKEQERKSKL